MICAEKRAGTGATSSLMTTDIRVKASPPGLLSLHVLRVFQESSNNEARIADQADRTITQATELGFIRELRGQPGAWEVRRILKAYVDAQTLSDFSERLAAYAGTAEGASQ